ncbi:hypothetical protein EMCRGX_G007173 [Ephydatia muelleri]
MARWLRRAAPGDRSQFSAPGWKLGTYCIQIAPQTALELVKYQHIICQLFAPDGSSLEPVPSRLTTTPAGTTPLSGVLGASHLNAGQEICQCFKFGRCNKRAECYFTHTCWVLSHATLCPVNSHHSTTSKLTPLYD